MTGGSAVNRGRAPPLSDPRHEGHDDAADARARPTTTATADGARLSGRAHARGLRAYERALAAGWSPDSERDASAERLRALRRDPEGFLRDIAGREPTLALDDGRIVPRLPTRAFWISDGYFAGTINLRFQPGAEELPDYVSGHVGYTVVPWRRGPRLRDPGAGPPPAGGQGARAGARAADLRPRERGLAPGHRGQRRRLRRRWPPPLGAGRVKLHFWVPTGEAPAPAAPVSPTVPRAAATGLTRSSSISAAIRDSVGGWVRNSRSTPPNLSGLTMKRWALAGLASAVGSTRPVAACSMRDSARASQRGWPQISAPSRSAE
jgi:hypothetical protein